MWNQYYYFSDLLKIRVFIKKELAEVFKGQMTCLGKSNEKYITFSVPIESKVETFDKIGKGITKTISYRLQFVGSTRFMESSLSNLVNNLAEWIHQIKRKSEINVKCVIEYKDYDCFLKYTNFKDYKYVGTRFIKKKKKKKT